MSFSFASTFFIIHFLKSQEDGGPKPSDPISSIVLIVQGKIIVVIIFLVTKEGIIVILIVINVRIRNFTSRRLCGFGLKWPTVLQ
jgi:hypothetical protein